MYVCVTNSNSSPPFMFTTGMTIVDDKDVGFLMGYLCPYSHKWGDIGTALHFLSGELKNIYRNHQEVQQCLKEVLCQWVQWPTAAHSQTPTIEMLRDALRSDLVGLGAVANQLYDARNELPSQCVSPPPSSCAATASGGQGGRLAKVYRSACRFFHETWSPCTGCEELPPSLEHVQLREGATELEEEPKTLPSPDQPHPPSHKRHCTGL